MIDNIVKTVSRLPAGLQFLSPVLVNSDGELHQIGWFLGSFSGISCKSTFFFFFTARHIKHKIIAEEILMSDEDGYTQKRVDEPWVLGPVPSNPVLQKVTAQEQWRHASASDTRRGTLESTAWKQFPEGLLGRAMNHAQMVHGGLAVQGNRGNI